MISEDLKKEVADWIKNDPDPKTAAQLQNLGEYENNNK